MDIEAVSAFIWADKKVPNIFELEPETIKEALEVDDKTLEQIQVCYNIFHTHHVFDDYRIFEKACCVLNGREADFQHMQEIHLAELAWAIECIRMIDHETKFSDEVLEYISIIIVHEGLFFAPENIANEISVSNTPISYYIDRNCPSGTLVQLEKAEVKNNQKAMLEHCKLFVKAKTENLQRELKEVMKHA